MLYPAPAAAGAAPPKLRQPRQRECYICHNSRAVFRQSFSGTFRTLTAPTTFLIPSHHLNEEPIEDGMSKIVLVFRLQDFENGVFCLVDAFSIFFSRHVPPICFSFPLILPQWNLVCLFFMVGNMRRFYFWPRFVKKNSSPYGLRKILCTHLRRYVPPICFFVNTHPTSIKLGILILSTRQYAAFLFLKKKSHLDLENF